MNKFAQILANLQNRVMLTVARGVVKLVNDDLKMQTLQLELLKRELRDNIERFQNYGFSSHPHPGAEAAVVFVGGNRDHGLVLAVDDRRYRLKSLQQGEVALYTDEGDSIVLKRGRVIEVTTETFRINATTKVEINTELLAVDAPLTTSTGDVQADGDILDLAQGDGITMDAMRTVYNSHHHAGVQPGLGSTAVPTEPM